MPNFESSLLNKNDVLGLTSLSNTTLYKLVSLNLFPRPVSIRGTRRVAWRHSDVQRWLSDQKSV